MKATLSRIFSSSFISNQEIKSKLKHDKKAVLIIFATEMLILNVMSKITIKDPYAFNGDALTKGSSPANKGFLLKKRIIQLKPKSIFTSNLMVVR